MLRVASVQRNGVQFFTSEPASCIRRRLPGSAGAHKYEIRTASKTFLARHFLFLATPTTALLNATLVPLSDLAYSHLASPT